MAEVEVKLDREAMACYALNVGDVNDLLEAAFAGRTVSTFVEGERRFEVLVRFPEGARRDIPSVEQLLVPAPIGQRVPLGQIASVRLVEGPMQTSREKGMRRVVVEAIVSARVLGGIRTASCGPTCGLGTNWWRRAARNAITCKKPCSK